MWKYDSKLSIHTHTKNEKGARTIEHCAWHLNGYVKKADQSMYDDGVKFKFKLVTMEFQMSFTNLSFVLLFSWPMIEFISFSSFRLVIDLINFEMIRSFLYGTLQQLWGQRTHIVVFHWIWWHSDEMCYCNVHDMDTQCFTMIRPLDVDCAVGGCQPKVHAPFEPKKNKN